MIDAPLTFKFALLGLIQGITEFLPVSSDGHLVVGEALLGIHLHDERGAAVEVALHAGTLGAVLVFVGRDLLRLLRGLVLPPPDVDPELRRRSLGLLRALFFGSLPAAVIGLLFMDFLESLFAHTWVAGIGFLITGAFLLSARGMGDGGRGAHELAPVQALLIGFCQALAIAPGVSRSGSTIPAGMRTGLSAVEAARFSFLLSVPAVGGATLLKAGDILSTPSAQLIPLAVGVLCAFGCGLLALKVLMVVLRRGTFSAFAWYVIPLGLVVLAASRWGR